MTIRELAHRGRPSRAVAFSPRAHPRVVGRPPASANRTTASPAPLSALRVARTALLAVVTGLALLFSQRDRVVGLTLCVPGTPLTVSGINPFSDLAPEARRIVSAHEARHAGWIRDHGCAAAYRVRLLGTVEERSTIEIDAGCAEVPHYVVGRALPRAAAESTVVRSLVAEYGSMRRLGFERTLALMRSHCRTS
jgi:hypothetical protein